MTKKTNPLINSQDETTSQSHSDGIQGESGEPSIPLPSGESPMGELPSELLKQIGSFLPSEQAMEVALLSRRYYGVFTDLNQHDWESKLVSIFKRKLEGDIRDCSSLAKKIVQSGNGLRMYALLLHTMDNRSGNWLESINIPRPKGMNIVFYNSKDTFQRRQFSEAEILSLNKYLSLNVVSHLDDDLYNKHIKDLIDVSFNRENEVRLLDGFEFDFNICILAAATMGDRRFANALGNNLSEILNKIISSNNFISVEYRRIIGELLILFMLCKMPVNVNAILSYCINLLEAYQHNLDTNKIRHFAAYTGFKEVIGLIKSSTEQHLRVSIIQAAIDGNHFELAMELYNEYKLTHVSKEKLFSVTTMKIAAKNNSIECLNWIFEGFEVQDKTRVYDLLRGKSKSDLSVFTNAACHGSIEALEFFLSKIDEDKRTDELRKACNYLLYRQKHIFPLDKLYEKYKEVREGTDLFCGRSTIKNISARKIKWIDSKFPGSIKFSPALIQYDYDFDRFEFLWSKLSSKFKNQLLKNKLDIAKYNFHISQFLVAELSNEDKSVLLNDPSYHLLVMAQNTDAYFIVIWPSLSEQQKKALLFADRFQDVECVAELKYRWRNRPDVSFLFCDYALSTPYFNEVLKFFRLFDVNEIKRIIEGYFSNPSYIEQEVLMTIVNSVAKLSAEDQADIYRSGRFSPILAILIFKATRDASKVELITENVKILEELNIATSILFIQSLTFDYKIVLYNFWDENHYLRQELQKLIANNQLRNFYLSRLENAIRRKVESEILAYFSKATKLFPDILQSVFVMGQVYLFNSTFSDDLVLSVLGFSKTVVAQVFSLIYKVNTGRCIYYLAEFLKVQLQQYDFSYVCQVIEGIDEKKARVALFKQIGLEIIFNPGHPASFILDIIKLIGMSHLSQNVHGRLADGLELTNYLDDFIFDNNENLHPLIVTIKELINDLENSNYETIQQLVKSKDNMPIVSYVVTSNRLKFFCRSSLPDEVMQNVLKFFSRNIIDAIYTRKLASTTLYGTNLASSPYHQVLIDFLENVAKIKALSYSTLMERMGLNRQDTRKILPLKRSIDDLGGVTEGHDQKRQARTNLPILKFPLSTEGSDDMNISDDEVYESKSDEMVAMGNFSRQSKR